MENGQIISGHSLAHIRDVKMFQYLKGAHIRDVAHWLILKAIIIDRLKGLEHYQKHKFIFMFK